tara:strand:+ start:210 stop:1970 length:1761 start_codon:yes stop_codon:yes gene_type:complete
MSFIVAAASTAAASAVAGVAGGVTVAGALGIATGAATAAVPLAAAGISTGVAAGAAAAGIGAGALAGSALGAGIGAIGAGITGGDVGKGALSGAVSGAVTGGIAPGLGGATAGLGGFGSGAITGGVAGAAGSAAGAAAVGEDAGKAALMGGGIGAVGGAIGGAMDTPTGDVTTAAGGDAVSADPLGTMGTGATSGTGAPVSADPLGTIGTGVTSGVPVTPLAPTGNGVVNQLGTNLGNAASDYGNVIMNNPVGLAKPALPDLATGAYYGGGLDTQYPTEQPTVTQDIGGAPLADNYQRTGDTARKTLPKYYAAGGGITGGANAKTPPPLFNETTPPAQAQPQPQTMNKFAGMGLEAAKIGDQAYQAQQQQQPQQPQAGIPRPQPPTLPQPSAQPNQPMFYAAGGAVQGPAQGDIRDTFTTQVRALAAQKVKEHYAQQARELLAQQQQAQQQQYTQPRSQVINTTNDGSGNSVSNIQPSFGYAQGGMAQDNLGGYSHGGIAGLTRGPGDGVSDSIPAQIGNSGKQPARLADGEFVIPSRIVSELGNGSTEAGAKALQAMVDRIQTRRSKTVGKGKVAVNSRARKELA